MLDTNLITSAIWNWSHVDPSTKIYNQQTRHLYTITWKIRPKTSVYLSRVCFDWAIRPDQMPAWFDFRCCAQENAPTWITMFPLITVSYLLPHIYACEKKITHAPDIRFCHQLLYVCTWFYACEHQHTPLHMCWSNGQGPHPNLAVQASLSAHIML